MMKTLKALLVLAGLSLIILPASAQLLQSPPLTYSGGVGSSGGSGACTGSFCAASAPLAVNLGGNGLDNSGATGIPLYTAGTQSILSTSGTGNVIRSASPTFTGTVTASAATLSGTLTTNLTGGGTQCVQASNTGILSGTGSACGAGGGGSPGGSNTQVQYNNSGSFGGISGLTTNGTVVTFADGAVNLTGLTSGTSILKAPATGGGTVTLPSGTTTIAAASNNLSFFASTTSAQLLGVLSDETGTGSAVFGTGPTIASPTITGAFTATGLVTNADLASSNITIGGASTSLGGTVTATTILDSVGAVQGDILYRNGANWAVLPPGTSGQLLQSGGAAANPSWVTASGTGSVTNVQAATTSPALTVNGGSGACSTSCLLGIQEALSPNSGSFGVSSYTIQATDLGTWLPRTNTGAMTDTMPDVGTTGFGQGVSLVISTGPAASNGQDTVSAASASLFMLCGTLNSSVVIPPGIAAKFTNFNNVNWAVSGIPCLTNSTTVISSGTNKAPIYDNNGKLGELAVVNSAVVVTSGTGVPSESTTLPSNLTIPSPTLSSPALGTIASGDLTAGTNYPVANLSGLGANVASALAASASGSSGGFCRSVGSACSGQAGGGVVSYSSGALTALTAGTYYAPFGGGGSPVATETAVQTRAPAASTVANLQVDLSVDPGNTQTVVVTARNNATGQTATCTITGNGSTNKTCSDTTHSFNPAQGDLLTFQVVNSATFTGTIQISATWGTTNVGVTSVTVTVPSRQTATGCVITTSGTCAITDNTQNANLMFAGPTSGSAAAPTFRSVVAADLPIICPSQYAVNNWFNPNGYTFNQTQFLGTGTNTMAWSPFTVCKTTTISNIGIAISTSGGTNGNLALYADSGGLPTGSFICASSVSTASTGLISMACSTQLVQGTVYWLATNEDAFTAKAISAGFGGAVSTQLVGATSSTNIGLNGAEKLTTTGITCCTTGALPTNPTITHGSNSSTGEVAVYIQIASIP